jgi:hypothetical protein
MNDATRIHILCIIKNGGYCDVFMNERIHCLSLCPLANGTSCVEPYDVKIDSAYATPQPKTVLNRNRYERALMYYTKMWGEEDIVETLL